MEKLQRVVERGSPVDFDAIEAPFNFTITSYTTIDTDAQPMVDFANRVSQLVRRSKFTCELYDIIIFFIITPAHLKGPGDSCSWRRINREYRIRRSIDFSWWETSKLSEKKKLLADICIESIEAIPVSRLSEESKVGLTNIVLQAIGAKKQLLESSIDQDLGR